MDGSRHAAPSTLSGVLVATALVAATTLVLYPLEDIAPVATLGVVYLLAVIVVATFWPFWLGAATTVVSAAAFNLFHLPPTGKLTLAEENHWISLAAFVVVGLATCTVAAVARRRAIEAEMRREEADLAAEAARLLLGESDLYDALRLVAERVATALGLGSAAIVLDEAAPVEPGREAFGLGSSTRLVVPAGLPAPVHDRLAGRIVPALEPLVSAARERERLEAEVVETAALRQSDVAKTAVLRAVSHDLRSPLTAMVTAGEALRSPSLDSRERDELASVVVEEGSRLSRLIEKLLDLSRLQSGTARPEPELVDVDDLLHVAAEAVPGARIDWSIAELCPVRADAAQLERAFANLLENAARHCGGHPVSVRARVLRDRVVVRVVDRGPGIPKAEQERIFEPFYRGSAAAARQAGGAGLGLAIVRGLVESNGGRVWVESLPGQGSSFVVELPAAPVPETVVAAE